MFSFLPPNIAVPIFYAIIVVGVLIRFLISNLYGIFILSIVLYLCSQSFFGVEPYNFKQLVDWCSMQSEGTKNSMLSAIITITGFLIAYATATYNWKAQALSQVRMQAAGEIDAFFSQCSHLVQECNIYAANLIEAINKIQKNDQFDNANFLAYYNRDQGKKFLQERQQLSSLGIEVHRLQGRYTNLLVLAPGLKRNMELASQALNKITEKIWFNVPFHINNDENPIQSFVNQVNVSDCIQFKNVVEENCDLLSFTSGAVRGNLQSKVVGFNIWSLVYLIKERKGFREAIESYYLSRNRNG